MRNSRYLQWNDFLLSPLHMKRSLNPFQRKKYKYSWFQAPFRSQVWQQMIWPACQAEFCSKCLCGCTHNMLPHSSTGLPMWRFQQSRASGCKWQLLLGLSSAATKTCKSAHSKTDDLHPVQGTHKQTRKWFLRETFLQKHQLLIQVNADICLTTKNGLLDAGWIQKMCMQIQT